MKKTNQQSWHNKDTMNREETIKIQKEFSYRIATHNQKKELHSFDGKPAVIYTSGAHNGRREWHKEGELHRDDGPAVEHNNGDKAWYKEGKPHRDDGPAVEYSNGTKVWYKEGKFHREDGPAIERSDGSRDYYIDGVKMTKDDFFKRKNISPKVEDIIKSLSREDKKTLFRFLADELF